MLPPTATNLQPNNILFGIPKKGRLNEKVCKLLDGAGLEYRRVSRRLLVDGGGCT
jgi:ATP phosphoribosyltransferase